MKRRDLYGKTSGRGRAPHIVEGYDIVGYTDIVGAQLMPAAVQTGGGAGFQGFGVMPGIALPPPGYMNQGGVMVPINPPPPQVGVPVGAPNAATRVISNDAHKVLRRQVLGFGSGNFEIMR